MADSLAGAVRDAATQTDAKASTPATDALPVVDTSRLERALDDFLAVFTRPLAPAHSATLASWLDSLRSLAGRTLSLSAHVDIGGG